LTKNVEINLNENSLDISRNNSITGEICFVFENQYFPELKWNDFVVKLLISWLQGINELKGIYNTSYEFHFMDGPFLVRVNKKDENTLKLDFLNREIKGEELIDTLYCSLETLIDSILISAHKVINEAKNKKWNSDELVKLKDIMTRK
jgi:hypothetical protein